jgi:hypothetical protein
MLAAKLVVMTSHRIFWPCLLYENLSVAIQFSSNNLRSSPLKIPNLDHLGHTNGGGDVGR